MWSGAAMIFGKHLEKLPQSLLNQRKNLASLYCVQDIETIWWHDRRRSEEHFWLKSTTLEWIIQMKTQNATRVLRGPNAPYWIWKGEVEVCLGRFGLKRHAAPSQTLPTTSNQHCLIQCPPCESVPRRPSWGPGSSNSSLMHRKRVCGLFKKAAGMSSKDVKIRLKFVAAITRD